MQNTWVAPPNPNNDMNALKLHMQLLKDIKPPVCAIFPAPPPALALEMCTDEWIPPRPAKTKKKKKGLPGRATVAEEEFTDTAAFMPITDIVTSQGQRGHQAAGKVKSKMGAPVRVIR